MGVHAIGVVIGTAIGTASGVVIATAGAAATGIKLACYGFGCSIYLFI